LTAELLRIYGQPIRGFIGERLTLVASSVLAVVVGGFVIAKYVI
jgi:hypothetical protein